MENCTMIRKNFRGFENYSKLRKNIREITQFDGAESGTLQVIRSLHVATNRAILASNVSIHA
jgi:hypothetical protein